MTLFEIAIAPSGFFIDANQETQGIISVLLKINMQ